ncbi:MAG: hypothetical protein HOK48_01440 [Actinobacteria bacterium]|nr:hypothetical protein [Actinomycetota bacterium]
MGAVTDAGVGAVTDAGVGASVWASVGERASGLGVEGIGTSFMAGLSREPGWSAAKVAALSLRVNRW